MIAAAPSRRPSVPLREYWALLRAYLLPQRGLVALMSLSLLLSIALTLVGPQIVRFFLDAAQAKRPESELLTAAGLFIASSVAQQGLAVLASYAATRVGWSATNNLRADLAEHCLKLDLSFHKSRTPGELIERIRTQLEQLQKADAGIARIAELMATKSVLRDGAGANWQSGTALTVSVRNLSFAYPADLNDATSSGVTSSGAALPLEADPSIPVLTGDHSSHKASSSHTVSSSGDSSGTDSSETDSSETDSSETDSSDTASSDTASSDTASSDTASSDNVLEELSFTLQAGRVLGLLGRTGSGKTTLARLLMRFYDPQSGAVMLDGVDLREARLEQVRQQVTLVTQNIELLSASVRDNLTFFDSSISDERVEDALERVGLRDWARGLAAGLDTIVESGALSAGESQLLAFARVFLRNPSVIVLDEASSKLDPATEALLERAMTELLRGRTAIIIAHRLKTIERADDILILERGRVLEAGTRVGLMANPDSVFSGLRRKGLDEVLA